MIRTFQLTKVLASFSVMENMRMGATGQTGERFLGGLFQTWRGQEKSRSPRRPRASSSGSC